MGSDLLAGHCGRHSEPCHQSSFHGSASSSQHNVEKKLDVGSDVMRPFPSQFSDVRSTVPNSIVSSYDIHSPVQITSAISSSSVSTIVENGMSDIDDTKRPTRYRRYFFDPRPLC